ncbi:MAG: hypothetical protein RIS47_1284 [Bacteroidota bacterium]
MVILKLIGLSAVLILIAMAGISIKLFFNKNAKPPTTSCKAGTEELSQRGVDACAIGECDE